MNNIVKQALRSIVMSGEFTFDFRESCLDELIAGSIVQPIHPLTGMNDFREYRRHHGRIETIKYVRTSIGCGLAEALILVKGIESHDNHVEIPF